MRTISERGRGSHLWPGLIPSTRASDTSCSSTLRARRAVSRAKTARRSGAVASMLSVHILAHVGPALAGQGARDVCHERQALVRGPRAREGDDEAAVVRSRAHAADASTRGQRQDDPVERRACPARGDARRPGQRRARRPWPVRTRPGRSERGSGRKPDARLLAGHLTLDIPDVEARDMKPNPVACLVEVLDHRLRGGHNLPARVAGLPVARASAGARDRRRWQAAVGEPFLN